MRKTRGNPADNPGLPVFPEDSQVGDPDLVMPMPVPYVHEGSMTDQYQVFVLPTGFETDMTIRSLEVMPGNHAIAHHAILGIDIPTAANLDAQDPRPAGESFGDFGFDAYENFFGGWVPGTLPVVYPEGIGRVIPAGSDLLVQMHYGPSAVEESDQTEINVFFTEGPVEREVTTGIMGPWALGEPFFIPANQVKVFHGEFPISSDISLINIVPHCHLIGASWEVFATSADGNDTIPLISIPEWDFNWQGFFTFPTLTKIPAGYTLEAIAVYDNTADNPFNPSSPPKTSSTATTRRTRCSSSSSTTEYQEGDEDISLETPLLTGIGALDPSGPLVKLQPNPNRGSVQLLWTLPLLVTLGRFWIWEAGFCVLAHSGRRTNSSTSMDWATVSTCSVRRKASNGWSSSADVPPRSARPMVGQGLIADDAGWCQCIEANLAGRMKDRPFSSPRVQRKTDMGHCILPFLMEEHEIAMLQFVPTGTVVF